MPSFDTKNLTFVCFYAFSARKRADFLRNQLFSLVFFGCAVEFITTLVFPIIEAVSTIITTWFFSSVSIFIFIDV